MTVAVMNLLHLVLRLVNRLRSLFAMIQVTNAPQQGRNYLQLIITTGASSKEGAPSSLSRCELPKKL